VLDTKPSVLFVKYFHADHLGLCNMTLIVHYVLSSRHYLGNTLYCMIFIRCINGEWVEGDKSERDKGMDEWDEG